MVSSFTKFVARGLALPAKDRRLEVADVLETQTQTLVVGKVESEGPAVLSDERAIDVGLTEKEATNT